MKVCIECQSPIDKGWNCKACGWEPDTLSGFPLLAPEIAGGFEGYAIDAHDRLAAIEKKSFWFVSRNRLLACLLDRYFPDAENMMEIGCGTGFVLAGLARHRPEMSFYGAEAYPAGLAHAQRRLPATEFIQMDARNIPYVEEFDVIGAFDLIDHIAEDRATLAEMHKALKPGGGIMITVPQHPWLWSKTDENAGHKRRYTRKELHEKAAAAGFNVCGTYSFISLLLPFMLASRLRSQYGTARAKKSGGSASGLILPGRLNHIFMGICDLERALVKAGISFPAGGSLVCIAKKQN